MKILLFGATGMVGQGVLRECLLDPEVEAVTTIGRSATTLKNPKVYEIVHADMFDYADVEDQLRGFDGCFFCLGVSSAGMPADDYERLTYKLTLAAAQTLSRLNPEMTFIYVSGAGTDSTEQGRVRWARVKGRTENALLRLPFRGAYMFRPGAIQPMHGERPKASLTRIALGVFKPLFPLLRFLFPGYVLTTEEIGRAMIQVARGGAPKMVLEIADIKACARRTVGGPEWTQKQAT
jgi:uncharacterized protein YbjT (DUF2867 family)